MIKLSTSVSLKAPLPDVEFSSRSCSAGIAVEMADAANAKELQEKLKALYALLEVAVDQQLNTRCQNPDGDSTFPAEARRPSQNRRRNNGNGRQATEAQVNAILAIARDRGLGERRMADALQRDFGVAAPADLTIRQASALIDRLKNGKERSHAKQNFE